jgi:hypothetical protein
MQGVFVNGERPRTKKELSGFIGAGNTRDVSLEATSLFGNEYDGPLCNAPDGSYHVVGPDPYTKRSWYATITVNGESVRVA